MLHAFAVRKAEKTAPFTTKLDVGASPSDPRWKALGYTDSDLNTMIIRSVIIDAQRSGRSFLNSYTGPVSETGKKLDEFFSTWTKGRTVTRTTRTVEIETVDMSGVIDPKGMPRAAQDAIVKAVDVARENAAKKGLQVKLPTWYVQKTQAQEKKQAAAA